jgi:signal transduction histidine kinase
MGSNPTDDRSTAGREAELAARLRDLHLIYRGLSHALRGPLNAIVLQTELLRPDLAEAGPNESRRIDILERELGKLRAETERFLCLLAPPGDAVGEWDASDLARDVVELVVHLARQRGVALEPLPEAPPLPLRGDRGDALAAMLRFTLDALDTLPVGGRLAIRTSGGDDGAVCIEMALETTAAGGSAPGSSHLELSPRAEAAIEALGGKLRVKNERWRTLLGVRLPSQLNRVLW